MVDVLAILGLSVAVGVLVWLATCGTNCRPPWKCCCRRCDQAQDVVTIQVDLRSGEVRTCNNTLGGATSLSPLHVTQVSRLSYQGAQDEVKVTPGTPTRTHASLITTATQTRLPSPVSLSTAESEYSTEVMPLDKSMWGSLSTSPTSTERSLLNTSGYTNTTYFEEATQATAQPSTQEAPKTGVLIELERLDNRVNSSYRQSTSESSDDSSLSRSTTTLLAKSDSCIFPNMADPELPPCVESDEDKENIDLDENKENIDPRENKNAESDIRPSCSGVTLTLALLLDSLEEIPEHTSTTAAVAVVTEVEGEGQNQTSSSVSEAGPLADSSTSPAASTSPVAKQEDDAQVPDSDIESYHTCEDDASDREEETPTKESLRETLDLSADCDVFAALTE